MRPQVFAGHRAVPQMLPAAIECFIEGALFTHAAPDEADAVFRREVAGVPS